MSQDSWIVDKTPRRRGETRTRDGVMNEMNSRRGEGLTET